MSELVKPFLYVLALLMAGLAVFAACADRRVTRELLTGWVGVTILGQAAAFLAPSIWAYHAACFVLVPMLATRPQRIAPIYLFALLTLPAVPTRVELSGTYLLSFDNMMALGLGALLTAIVRPPRGRAIAARYDVPIIVVAIILAAAAARDESATNLLRVMTETLLQLVLPYAVLRASVRQPDDLYRALAGIVAAVAILSVLALYEAWSGWPLYWAIWGHYDATLGPAASVKLRAGLLRAMGPIGEPTGFGYCLMVGGIAAVALRRLFRSPDRQAAIVALILIGMVAPQSRGAWLGFAVGYAALLAYRRQWSKVSRLAVGGLLAALFAVVGAAASPRLAVFLGLTPEGFETVDYRRNLFWRGLAQVGNHPWFGDTMANVVLRLRDLQQGEGIVDFVNTYLYVALIAGLVGLALFVAMIALPPARLWAARGELIDGPAAAVFGAFAAMAAALAFTSLGGRPASLLVIAMAGAAILTAARRPTVGRSAPLLSRRVPAMAGEG